jgi:hypothetical protein
MKPRRSRIGSEKLTPVTDPTCGIFRQRKMQKCDLESPAEPTAKFIRFAILLRQILFIERNRQLVMDLWR